MIIVVVVVGGAFIVGVLVFLILFFLRRRKTVTKVHVLGSTDATANCSSVPNLTDEEGKGSSKLDTERHLKTVDF